MSVNELTTVAIPREVREKLGQLQETTARKAESEPLWYTVDRALTALEAEETDE